MLCTIGFKAGFLSDERDARPWLAHVPQVDRLARGWSRLLWWRQYHSWLSSNWEWGRFHLSKTMFNGGLLWRAIWIIGQLRWEFKWAANCESTCDPFETRIRRDDTVVYEPRLTEVMFSVLLFSAFNWFGLVWHSSILASNLSRNCSLLYHHHNWTFPRRRRLARLWIRVFETSKSWIRLIWDMLMQHLNRFQFLAWGQEVWWWFLLNQNLHTFNIFGGICLMSTVNQLNGDTNKWLWN